MMPSFAVVHVSESRRVPPLPLPLFLLWPLVPVSLGVAELMKRARPDQAAKLRIAALVCCELRGLSIDVDTSDHKRVRIRFV